MDPGSSPGVTGTKGYRIVARGDGLLKEPGFVAQGDGLLKDPGFVARGDGR
jgi:hypothetical protein